MATHGISEGASWAKERGGGRERVEGQSAVALMVFAGA